MIEANQISAIIVLPKIQVQNANAISGPLTWGFPPPSAFLGLSHALALKPEIKTQLGQGICATGIVCHEFKPRTTKLSNRAMQVFSLQRNPLSKKGDIDKNGHYKMPGILDQGHAHLEITLVLALTDYLSDKEGAYLAEDMMMQLQSMRIAGGSVLPQRQGETYAAKFYSWPDMLDAQGQVFRKIKNSLLPGFTLVLRQDYMQQQLASLDANKINSMTANDAQAETQQSINALEVLLDVSRLNFEPHITDPDQPEHAQWLIRKKPGWLVPIPVAYAGLSPLYEAGMVKNSRDDDKPFRFVESLYSIGEWLSPHRLKTLKQMLWYQHYEQDKNLYYCCNDYATLSENDLEGHHHDQN